MDCPQCGNETEQLFEGYCKECYEDNQRRLDEFNFRQEYWDRLNQEKKDEWIKKGCIY